MKKKFDVWLPFLILVLAALAVCLIVIVSRTARQLRYNELRDAAVAQQVEQWQEAASAQAPVFTPEPVPVTQPEPTAEPAPEATPEPTPEPTPTPAPTFAPASTDETVATVRMSGAQVIVGDAEESQEISLTPVLDAAAPEQEPSEEAPTDGDAPGQTAEPDTAEGETQTGTEETQTTEADEETSVFHLYDGEAMSFAEGDSYTALKGIVTFRGNNFRDTAAYGTAELSSKTFADSAAWKVSTGALYDVENSLWGGSGWTGQPLVAEWPQSTKDVMNMYDWAKQKDGLVEVILACLDGKVYFIDLETGELTRDPIELNYSFKGAGSLDPRGYPLLYVGGGLTNGGYSKPRIMVVSLITGETLYTVGNSDEFSTRSNWTAYDSSPLVDAETDTLIYPGENGIMYFIRLHSAYDEAAGTLTVDPTVTRWRYESDSCEDYYYGMEDSAVAWCGHLMIADNGGNFFCLNLDTLAVEWCVDCLDDTNCSPVLELEDGHPYVYLSTSFHYGWRGYYTETVPVWKIDAVTGETVWQHDYECFTESGVSGGVQGTPALGRGTLDGILYVPIGMNSGGTGGLLAALDTETGEELWTYNSPSFTWSSPVCFYGADGNGYVLFVSHGGSLWLFDGLSGELLDDFDTGQTLEASPIVYNNRIVIGSRWNTIWGLTLQ